MISRSGLIFYRHIYVREKKNKNTTLYLVHIYIFSDSWSELGRSVGVCKTRRNDTRMLCVLSLGQNNNITIFQSESGLVEMCGRSLASRVRSGGVIITRKKITRFKYYIQTVQRWLVLFSNPTRSPLQNILQRVRMLLKPIFLISACSLGIHYNRSVCLSAITK